MEKSVLYAHSCECFFCSFIFSFTRTTEHSFLGNKGRVQNKTQYTNKNGQMQKKMCDTTKEKQIITLSYRIQATFFYFSFSQCLLSSLWVKRVVVFVLCLPFSLNIFFLLLHAFPMHCVFEYYWFGSIGLSVWRWNWLVFKHYNEQTVHMIKMNSRCTLHSHKMTKRKQNKLYTKTKTQQRQWQALRKGMNEQEKYTQKKKHRQTNDNECKE